VVVAGLLAAIMMQELVVLVAVEILEILAAMEILQPQPLLKETTEGVPLT
jgi:hypothetical protein